MKFDLDAGVKAFQQTKLRALQKYISTKRGNNECIVILSYYRSVKCKMFGVFLLSLFLNFSGVVALFPYTFLHLFLNFAIFLPYSSTFPGLTPYSLTFPDPPPPHPLPPVLFLIKWEDSAVIL